MSNWKYTDASKRAVSRTYADGRGESCAVEAIADWIALGNTPEPADVPTAAEIAQAVISSEETIHKISQRFLREQALLLGIQGGIITTAMLDYTIPLDTNAASWTSLNYGAQLCVLQERICRQQRAIIKAAGG